MPNLVFGRITFCIYYSQLQDWHHPDGVGNDWDFPADAKKDFEKYIEEKVKPQLQELLTGYGPIGLIWFDTPYEMPKAYCKVLVDFVRAFTVLRMLVDMNGKGRNFVLNVGPDAEGVIPQESVCMD